VNHFFSIIEQSGFSTWVRESGSLWAYPFILFCHTVGLGIVMGTSTAIDLRILGFAPRIPLSPLERFYPFMWTGFWINAISGVILLAADATTKVVSPIFYTKMAFITLAVWIIQLFKSRLFGHPDSLDVASVPGKDKMLAAASLVCWLGAVTAGRLMAYLGPVSGIPGATNHF
jgi:hypothetical protein